MGGEEKQDNSAVRLPPPKPIHTSGSSVNE
jgi:hypothetical protein